MTHVTSPPHARHSLTFFSHAHQAILYNFSTLYLYINHIWEVRSPLSPVAVAVPEGAVDNMVMEATLHMHMHMHMCMCM